MGGGCFAVSQGLENRDWKLENGKWKMENGEWGMVSPHEIA